MLENRVTVINDLGLHARAAAQLVKTARLFSSRIILTHSGSGITANAKSILSLLYLAASKGVTVVVNVDGDDETEAAAAIEKLFLEGFGEL